MNIKEWHQAFKVQLDTLDTQSALRLQPEVVDVFFNKAINKIMVDLYNEYEETQEISDALSSQTIITSITPTLITGTNTYIVNLPPDYYHHLQSNATLAIGASSGIVRTVKQLLDSESKVISNPFEKADDTEVPIFFKAGAIYVYAPKDYNLTNFSLTYLKNPIKVAYKPNSIPVVAIDSDIDEYLHERIINLAVIYALETYGSERTAAKVQIKDVN
jgi:hypothetical protein